MSQATSISDLPLTFAADEIGPPSDAIKNKIKYLKTSNLSCIPAKDDSREKAYHCNRWASALLSTNSNTDYEFRAAILLKSKELEEIILEYEKNEFFEDRK